jgi:hypothetical protein
MASRLPRWHRIHCKNKFHTLASDLEHIATNRPLRHRTQDKYRACTFLILLGLLALLSRQARGLAVFLGLGSR